MAIYAKIRSLSRVNTPQEYVINSSEMAFITVARQPKPQILIQGNGIQVKLEDIKFLFHG
jgi:hypothetical protein